MHCIVDFCVLFLQDCFGQQHVVEVLTEEMEEGRSATCLITFSLSTPSNNTRLMKL